MLNSNQKKWAVLTILFIANFLLGLFGNTKLAYAQDYEETINFPQKFQLDEYYEKNGLMENITSIDIELASSRWNITDIELNFTDIKFIREIKEIETNFRESLQKRFYKKTPGFAVQINISELTEVYSVHIHGQMISPNTTVPIYIEIQGYDDITDEPNGTVYGSTYLNITSGNNWYIQNFQNPVSLSAGKYYLVLNAIGMPQNDGAEFLFSYNFIDPIYPNLYTWEYNGGWKEKTYGEPFLYKLDRKIIGTFNPEESNMTVEINGIAQPVNDSIEPQSGYFNLEHINFFPDDKILHIPIKNNRSEKLIFNLSYQINMRNQFLTDGNLKINTDKEIRWNVNFNLNRSQGNYTVKFDYPNSWTNFSVLKNHNPLTHGVHYINNNVEKAIFIFNETIPDENITWKITGESPNIPFNFNGPDLKIIAGSESISGVSSPLIGNYTYILYTGVYEKYRNTTVYKGDPVMELLSFQYIIPDIGPNGEWSAILYWNNGTDAGVESSTFTVSGGVTIISGGGGGGGGSNGTTGLDPILVFIVSLIGIIGTVGGFATYKKLQTIKRQRDLELMKLHTQFIDILSLNYLLVVDKKTGLNIYEQFFSGKEIDASLISGFFEAIRNFGIELTGTSQQSQTVKLEYQKLKILMSEFRDFRIILIMAENPSDDFLTKITQLSYDIDQNFGHLLQDFKGVTTEFKGLKVLIEKNLNTSFIAPLKIIEVSDLDLKPAEIALINEAKSIMEQKNLDYFYTRSLLSEQLYDPKKTRTIFNLINKKIFIPTKLS